MAFSYTDGCTYINAQIAWRIFVCACERCRNESYIVVALHARHFRFSADDQLIVFYLFALLFRLLSRIHGVCGAYACIWVCVCMRMRRPEQALDVLDAECCVYICCAATASATVVVRYDVYPQKQQSLMHKLSHSD